MSLLARVDTPSLTGIKQYLTSAPSIIKYNRGISRVSNTKPVNSHFLRSDWLLKLGI